ncbi:hypothetical protein HYV50_00525 [Candidatus Pacearchaeota archaeon]|nr:hypothetical protein [Candidatus Pacearchaeota archaeon]
MGIRERITRWIEKYRIWNINRLSRKLLDELLKKTYPYEEGSNTKEIELMKDIKKLTDENEKLKRKLEESKRGLEEIASGSGQFNKSEEGILITRINELESKIKDKTGEYTELNERYDKLLEQNEYLSRDRKGIVARALLFRMGEGELPSELIKEAEAEAYNSIIKESRELQQELENIRQERDDLKITIDSLFSSYNNRVFDLIEEESNSEKKYAVVLINLAEKSTRYSRGIEQLIGLSSTRIEELTNAISEREESEKSYELNFGDNTLVVQGCAPKTPLRENIIGIFAVIGKKPENDEDHQKETYEEMTILIERIENMYEEIEDEISARIRKKNLGFIPERP